MLAVLVAGLVFATAATAGAEVLARCSNAPRDRALCGQVVVPLDRGGALPGTIALRVKALPPTGGGAPSGTVLAIAGGPGQAAVPLLDTFAGALRPALRTRQLVTFDQRGTGGSGRLRCPALEGSGALVSAVGRCASELGARRTSYTTAASVADVEAVRAALGVDKLILYAASYGTKVALLYAATYPEHVDRLVLDSVVLPDGIDPFQRSTLGSIPRVLHSVCAGRCAFTHTPGDDVAALARRLARQPLRGTVLDGRGRPHRVGISEPGLLSLLLNGDFDRYLRAALPAAVHGALAGDPAPLLRLTVGGGGAGALSPRADSDAVYAATTCQDGNVPWPTGTPLEQRRAAVDAAAAAIAAHAFAPFDRATVRALGSADICRAWPESPIVQPLPALPATPTLILSGDEDLRTPRLDAVALAARLPGAHLLEVPDAGHGVLFSDPTDCAEKAVAAFAGGLVPGDCRHHEQVVPPLPLAPLRLAQLRPAPSVRGHRGRTITAVVRTLDDASGQVIEQFLGGGPPHPFGGLRAGSAALERGRGLRLRGYAYVPGVTVSGLVPSRAQRFTLAVSGRAAAHGRLTLSSAGVVGRLDGRPVRVSARALGWRSGGAGATGSAAAAAAALALGMTEPSPLRPPTPAAGPLAPSPLRSRALDAGLRAPDAR
jgi:pimeloyl-ACP methyl ester carboxylesterase